MLTVFATQASRRLCEMKKDGANRKAEKNFCFSVDKFSPPRDAAAS